MMILLVALVAYCVGWAIFVPFAAITLLADCIGGLLLP